LKARRRFTARARADIEAIGRRIAEESSRARAIAYTQALEVGLARLDEFPESARLCPDYGVGVRALVFGRFLVLYRREAAAGMVVVLRVVAAAQWPRPV
jgi:plasmid stabilization system protein ParE